MQNCEIIDLWKKGLSKQKLAEIYKDKVDLIVNAGTIENKIPSTLYDCIENKILRQGNVHLNI